MPTFEKDQRRMIVQAFDRMTADRQQQLLLDLDEASRIEILLAKVHAVPRWPVRPKWSQ